MDETSRTHRRGTCKERPLVEKIRLLVGFACSWVALGMPLAGFAQEPPIPTPLSLPSPSVSAIPPISVAAVLLRWEQLKPQLQSLRARAGKGDLTREIESQLGGLETSLAEQAGKDWAVLVPESSIATLSAVGSRWRSSRATLDGWTESLSGRVASLTDSEQEVLLLRAPWIATAESDEALDVPNAQAVKDALQALDGTRSLLVGRRAEVLQLQERVTALLDYPRTILEEISLIRVKQAQNLFVRESPPLWEAATFHRVHLPSASSQPVRSLINFASKRVPALVGLLVLALLLSFAVLGLQRFARRELSDDPALEKIMAVLQHPFSAGTLLALLAMPWLIPERSPAVVNFSWLILVGPLMTFMSPLVNAEVRKSLHALGGWLILDALRIFLFPGPLGNRLALVAEGLAALALSAWILRRHQTKQDDLPGLDAGLRVTFVLLVVALASNVVGNVTLAEVITEGALFSGLSLVAVVAIPQIINFCLLVGLRSKAAQGLQMVRHQEELIRNQLVRVAKWAVWLLWFWLALERFRVAEVSVRFVGDVLSFPLRVGGFGLSLGDVVSAGLVLWVSIHLSRFVRFVLDEEVLPRAHLPRGVPYATSVLTGYIIIVLGALSSAAAAGIDMSRFALVVSALGVGVGIGLQDVVNNFVSGLILLFERPLQVGDTVDVEGGLGTVKRIGLRSSTLKSFDGAERVVPNSRFISQEFTNWTLSDKTRRVEIAIGVAYGTSPHKVVQILLDVARGHEGILSFPEPSAIMTGYGESSLDFSLRAWTGRDEQWVGIRSDLLIAIGARLEEAGIEIPFPQRDLHVIAPN